MALKVKEEKVDNGMRIIAVQADGLESVGESIAVNYGSVDEPKNSRGFAHALEHMLFKGTKTKSWKDITESFKEMGATENAETRFEETIYYGMVHKSEAERLASLLADMIKNSTIPEEEFKKEKGALLGELKMIKDNPLSEAIFLSSSTIYKKSPAKYPIIGNESFIRNMKSSMLRKEYLKNYTPENIVAVIYGGISVEKGILLLKRHFEEFARSGKKVQRKVAKGEKSEEKELEKNTNQSAISVSYRCRPLDSIGTFATLLLAENMLSSRLFDEVREKRGLSYATYARYEFAKSFSFISAVSNASKEPDEVLKIIKRESHNFFSGQIGEQEFKKHKNGLSNILRMRMDDSLVTAIQISTFANMGMSVNEYLGVDSEIRRLSLKEFKDSVGELVEYDDPGIYFIRGKRS
ncbi:MAG: pitrilysin family protein [Candidatus Micrarchaeaceae archaeon]